MKKNILLVSFILAIFSSCEIDENLALNLNNPVIAIDQTEIAVPRSGGLRTITFLTNKSWTAKSSDENWCTVSPESGEELMKSIIVTIAPNDTDADRSCNVTITAGSSSQTITINQSLEENIIITSEKSLELTGESQTLEVELQTKVDFNVIIPEAAQSWVSYTEPRTLRTEYILLTIAENESGEVRTTEIYIKEKGTSFQDTLTINQNPNKSTETDYTVNVGTMGTLGAILDADHGDKGIIETLTITGELNKADFDVMKTEMPNLKHLDLKDVTCENDEIPIRAFGDSGAGLAYQGIESIVLPVNLKKIGAVAFRNCSNLTGPIILPEGLTHIGNHAFYSAGLTGSLFIPSKVTHIGDHAFRNCNFNGTLTFAEDIELVSIGIYAFNDCSGFTGPLTLPTGGGITIGSSAFNGCSGFTNPLGNPLIIPNSVNVIRPNVFVGCSGIEAIEFRKTTMLQYGKTQSSAPFERTYDEDVEIRVPETLLDEYIADPGWSEFHAGNIIGY